jgi:hypothetical protein
LSEQPDLFEWINNSWFEITGNACSCELGVWHELNETVEEFNRLENEEVDCCA